MGLRQVFGNPLTPIDTSRRLASRGPFRVRLIRLVGATTWSRHLSVRPTRPLSCSSRDSGAAITGGTGLPASDGHGQAETCRAYVPAVQISDSELARRWPRPVVSVAGFHASSDEVLAFGFPAHRCPRPKTRKPRPSVDYSRGGVADREGGGSRSGDRRVSGPLLRGRARPAGSVKVARAQPPRAFVRFGHHAREPCGATLSAVAATCGPRGSSFYALVLSRALTVPTATTAARPRAAMR